jgi:3-methyl-2-oxobutanoate hydroxymethyltransferase
VITDTLGFGDWTPKHARKYADLRGTILAAVEQYRADVEAGTFPGEAETVLMDGSVLDEVLGRSAADRPAATADLAGIPLDRDL